jgi:hypothetical protein
VGCAEQSDPGAFYFGESHAPGSQLFSTDTFWRLQMSLFNLGSHVHSNLPVTSGRADTSYHGELHDPETGRLVKFHSPGQRKSFLTRNPNIDPASLPPVHDYNRVPAWDNASTVAGEPADLRLRAERRARNAALLADPSSLTRREATKPATYTLFRICGHESAHAVVAHRLGLTVARVTTHPRDGLLGQVFHADGSRQATAVVLLAGREGEIALLGNAGTGDGSDTRQALKHARDEAGGDEGKAAELMRTWRQVAKQMVSDNLRAISKLAFELHRRREIDWDDYTQGYILNGGGR